MVRIGLVSEGPWPVRMIMMVAKDMWTSSRCFNPPAENASMATSPTMCKARSTRFTSCLLPSKAYLRMGRQALNVASKTVVW